MTAYAEVAHVKARAGFLSGAWEESTKPSTTDVQGFLDDVAGEIRAAISGLGFALPAVGSDSAASLRGLNADGALLLALDATFPAGEGPAEATELQKAVRARYERWWDRLLGGRHPATTSTAQSDPNVRGATDFWSENPEYGLNFPPWSPPPDARGPNASLDPLFYRGMPL